jgi:glycosyltransferase involved in cell wall biosynthesis
MPAREKTIVFAGVLNARKGILPLLHAFAANAELRRYTLVVFGEGDAEGEAKSFSAERQLPVRFEGWQSPLVIREALLRARALVLPSRQESFGVVMAEALCCGAPVLGWEATIRELESLFRIPVGASYRPDASEAELAKDILSLLQDKTYSNSWRRATQAMAQRTFHRAAYVQQNLDLYARVIG